MKSLCKFSGPSIVNLILTWYNCIIPNQWLLYLVLKSHHRKPLCDILIMRLLLIHYQSWLLKLKLLKFDLSLAKYRLWDRLICWRSFHFYRLGRHCKLTQILLIPIFLHRRCIFLRVYTYQLFISFQGGIKNVLNCLIFI